MGEIEGENEIELPPSIESSPNSDEDEPELEDEEVGNSDYDENDEIDTEIFEALKAHTRNED